MLFIFFFFKQKTAYELRISDWSSDVCSSDLTGGVLDVRKGMQTLGRLRRLGTQGVCRHRPDEEDMVGHVQRRPGDARIGRRGGPAVVGQGADDKDLAPGLG